MDWLSSFNAVRSWLLKNWKWSIVYLAFGCIILIIIKYSASPWNDCIQAIIALGTIIGGYCGTKWIEKQHDRWKLDAIDCACISLNMGLISRNRYTRYAIMLDKFVLRSEDDIHFSVECSLPSKDLKHPFFKGFQVNDRFPRVSTKWDRYKLFNQLQQNDLSKIRQTFPELADCDPKKIMNTKEDVRYRENMLGYFKECPSLEAYYNYKNKTRCTLTLRYKSAKKTVPCELSINQSTEREFFLRH